jgi:hypothetical protein
MDHAPAGVPHCTQAPIGLPVEQFTSPHVFCPLHCTLQASAEQVMLPAHELLPLQVIVTLGEAAVTPPAHDSGPLHVTVMPSLPAPPRMPLSHELWPSQTTSQSAPPQVTSPVQEFWPEQWTLQLVTMSPQATPPAHAS